MRIRKQPLTALILWLALIHSTNAETDSFKLGLEASDRLSMSVISLREQNCGGQMTRGNQDAKNLRFTECVAYVLGVVDMLREWQKIDPPHAPSVCVPRNTTSGQLIIVVQDYIEKAAPWRARQNDATPAIIEALKAQWPCSPR
jgi:hypothetical protein